MWFCIRISLSRCLLMRQKLQDSAAQRMVWCRFRRECPSAVSGKRHGIDVQMIRHFPGRKINPFQQFVCQLRRFLRQHPQQGRIDHPFAVMELTQAGPQTIRSPIEKPGISRRMTGILTAIGVRPE